MFKRMVLAVLVVAAPVALSAQFTTPHTIAVAGDTVAVLGATTFVNHGLVGVGRISATSLDSFGDTFGSVSGLQVTGWTNNGNGSYSGTFNILPDRGYNTGNFYSNYAARINQVGFTFTPYTGAANVGGVTDAEKIAHQNQIVLGLPASGLKFTYDDPMSSATLPTTGLDPGPGSAAIFGMILPYTSTFTGQQTPTSVGDTAFTGVNRLPLDSEALVLKADGSGYIGDEYGGNVYYFNAAKKITGVIVPPSAFQPHVGAALNFSSTGTPAPENGRRNNQGFEGVSLSPDGSRLFVLMQSAAVQDSNPSANDQLAKHTRLLIYDVSTNVTPTLPSAEFVLTLPTYKANGNGGAANKTCAQSEIVALDNFRFLVLSRDGNGLGNASLNPSMFKSVLLVDTRVGTPTEISATSASTSVGGKITTAPGVLNAAITPLSNIEALNMLNSTQLNKFNILLDTGAAQVSKLTLGEKWEGMALTYAADAANPNDYFLFIANDNDFVTSAGHMPGPGGAVTYNAFTGYDPLRVPAPVGGTENENDTMFLAFRVTITPDPTAPSIVPQIVGTLGTNGWYTSNVSVTWVVTDPQSGIGSTTGCGPASLTTDTGGVTLTCQATNNAGLPNAVSVTIKIDKTAPVITDLPVECSLWPPNHKMVTVGTVHASDATSGLLAGSFLVTGNSNEASDPSGPDVVIGANNGGISIQLRADRNGDGGGRIYSLGAVATDRAGNTTNATATCVVPHDKGKGL